MPSKVVGAIRRIRHVQWRNMRSEMLHIKHSDPVIACSQASISNA